MPLLLRNRYTHGNQSIYMRNTPPDATLYSAVFTTLEHRSRSSSAFFFFAFALLSNNFHGHFVMRSEPVWNEPINLLEWFHFGIFNAFQFGSHQFVINLRNKWLVKCLILMRDTIDFWPKDMFSAHLVLFGATTFDHLFRWSNFISVFKAFWTWEIQLAYSAVQNCFRKNSNNSKQILSWHFLAFFLPILRFFIFIFIRHRSVRIIVFFNG